MKRFIVGGVVAALTGGVACGGNGADVTTPEPPPVAFVTVSPDTATLRLGVVQTLEFTAVTKDATGVILSDRPVSWSSTAPAIAAISPAGVLTAVDSGVTTITATAEGRSGTAFAVVAPMDATALCNDTTFSRSEIRSSTCPDQGVWLLLEGATAPQDTAAPPPPGDIPTATTITADDPDPSVAEQSVTIQVRVTSVAGAPTGTVLVADGTTSCAVALVDGEGSCPLPFATAGERRVVAIYAGSGRFAASADDEAHQVQPSTDPPPPPPPPIPAATTTTITAHTPDPSTPGQAITVAVAVYSSAEIPSGEVRVTASGGSEECSAGLDEQGQGICTLVLTELGARTLTAEYPGNSYLAPSFSSEPHTVQSAPPIEVAVPGE